MPAGGSCTTNGIVPAFTIASQGGRGKDEDDTKTGTDKRMSSSMKWLPRVVFFFTYQLLSVVIGRTATAHPPTQVCHRRGAHANDTTEKHIAPEKTYEDPKHPPGRSLVFANAPCLQPCLSPP